MLDQSLKLRYISFLKDEAQRTKQFCVWYGHGMAIEITRSDYGVRVFLLKFTNTELVHQLIRRLNSFNCFVVGRRFRSLFG